MDNVLIFKPRKIKEQKLNKAQIELQFLSEKVKLLLDVYTTDWSILAFKLSLNSTTKRLRVIKHRYLTENEKKLLHGLVLNQTMMIEYVVKQHRLSKFKLIKSA